MTEEKKMLFSQDALKKLLWPLIIEQFLAIAMGMADTVMAASCGEAVVSGISLVDSICVLLIGLFTAMASGGAVVAAQYMGHGDKEMVGRASNQLFYSGWGCGPSVYDDSTDLEQGIAGTALRKCGGGCHECRKNLFLYCGGVLSFSGNL